jgi:DNA-binding response OmpR family regulator
MSEHIPTLLILEDEKALAEVWTGMFRKEGMDVMTVSSVDTAFAVTLKRHPDLLIVSLNKNNSDSIGLIKKLRASSWGKDLPVMYLNGEIYEDLPEKADRVAQERNNTYFNKNWSFGQVLEAVKKRLGYMNLKREAI